MTVRKTAAITLSIFVFLFGFGFLIKNYSNLLSENIPEIMEYIPAVELRLMPYGNLGNYYPTLFSLIMWVILFACLIDGILNKKVAFGLLSSINIPILLFIGTIILLFIEQLSLIRLWGILLLLMLIGLYFTFIKIIRTHMKATGSYNSYRYNNSFKGVYLAVNSIIEDLLTGREATKCNVIDRVTAYVVASILFVLEIILFISFIVYMITYWSFIF